MHQVLFWLISFCSISFHGEKTSPQEWISLFDGETLQGWKVGENPQTFTVKNGSIMVNGPVAHLFYDGPVGDHNFKNFEFKADIMTLAGSNSGVYIHTQYQEGGWPQKGYEVQVNNSHTDWRRTAGLYAIQDVRENYATDGEWFTMHITVRDKRITVIVNDRLVSDYTEPDGVTREASMKDRLLSSGTIALQGHDPQSTVYYKNLKIKLLPGQ